MGSLSYLSHPVKEEIVGTFKGIDWRLVGDIILYILKNYFLQIVFYVIVFVVLGLILSVIYSIVLSKYKFLKRQNKYYSWAVKLYIPFIFIINLLFSFKLGVLVGGYSAIKNDSYNISKQIYYQSTSLVFDNEDTKEASLNTLQSFVKELDDGNKELKISLNEIAQNYNADIVPIDNSKNWLANKLIQNYGDRIHTLSLYVLLNLTPHINVSEQISYEDFDKAIEFLLEMDPENIEDSLIRKIQHFTNYILRVQFKSILTGLVLIWIILLVVPVLEFYIYHLIMRKNTVRQ